jgi:hypothetical protein
MTKKSKIILFFILALVAIVYIALAQYYGNRRAKKQYDLFFNSNLIGSLEYVDIKFHGVAFKLIKDKNEYVFYPNTSRLNDMKIFYQFAKVGDSILKPIKSDTLVLVKNHKPMKYTFHKINK